MAHRQRSRVTMLRRCFWAGAWFDSGYMFQRRRTVEGPVSVHRQSGGFALLYRDRSAQCQTVHSRRLPCHGAEDVSLVPCSRPQRFPSCSLLIRWSSWLCRSCSSGTRRVETVEIPQLQPVFLDPVVRTLVVCNDRCPWSMSSCSSSTVLTSL